MQHLLSNKFGIKILSRGEVRPLAMADHACHFTNNLPNKLRLAIGSGEERPDFPLYNIFNDRINKPRRRLYIKVPPGLEN